MKRMTRHTVGIMLGLTLGWLAAGYIPAWFNAPADTLTYGHVDPVAHGDAGHKSSPTSANLLVPHQDDAPFHHTVLALIAGLFAAACLIGLALRGLGENDPAIVATDQDNAEAAHHPSHEGDEESHGDAHGDKAHGSHGAAH